MVRMTTLSLGIPSPKNKTNMLNYCIKVYFTPEEVGKVAGSIQDKCKSEQWKQFRGISVTTYAFHIYIGEAQTIRQHWWLKTAEGACGLMRRWLNHGMST